MAGFGFKTSWLAVRGRSPERVADALGLTGRRVLDWAAGTGLAYRQGVYVAAPLGEWTLAHGRLHLLPGFDATEPAFPGWLRGMSLLPGEVQFFACERVPDYHAWASARDGEIERAYCFIGERGEVPLFLGEPTPAEIETGIGVCPREAGWESWSEADWDGWFTTTPSEHHVMAIAGRWSVDPSRIDNDAMTGPGIHGLPAAG